jgi:hypothetical protein
MGETRQQLKARLQAARVWQEFVRLRDHLAAGGLTPAQARQEARRRVEALPPPAPVPRPDGPHDPPPAADPGEPVLSTESEGLLAAMRWVVTHGPEQDRSWEQRHTRAWLAAAPAAFYQRLAAVEEQAKAESGEHNCSPVWDGKGPCPTCGHQESPPGVTEELIEDLLRRAAAAGRDGGTT